MSIVRAGMCGALAALLAAQLPSAGAAPVVGFKELRLGMLQQAVARTRPLSCTPLRSLAPSDYLGIWAAHASGGKEPRLEMRTVPGHAKCTVRRRDTVAGMQIGELVVTFVDRSLTEITIDIDERGKTTSDWAGGSLWLSGKIDTLIESLDGRYGAHTTRQIPECPRSRGCRGAPVKNTLVWRPAGATATLTYWEATYLGMPRLVLTAAPALQRNASRGTQAGQVRAEDSGKRQAAGRTALDDDL